jgi:hypothetical protein
MVPAHILIVMSFYMTPNGVARKGAIRAAFWPRAHSAIVSKAIASGWNSDLAPGSPSTSADALGKLRG